MKMHSSPMFFMLLRLIPRRTSAAHLPLSIQQSTTSMPSPGQTLSHGKCRMLTIFSEEASSTLPDFFKEQCGGGGELEDRVLFPAGVEMVEYSTGMLEKGKDRGSSIPMKTIHLL
eukprot:GFUD01048380.1.p2 GENE.GFUD01048380.1~~GFUD01048380.1.p2  ORF type:complete len:115 (-),score=28.76 GFUD01048380.1:25-369(-)